MITPSCRGGDELDLAEQTLSALLRAHLAVRLAFEDRVRTATGLSTAEADVLASIGRTSDGRLRMVDIAEQMMLSKSGVTQLVDRLTTSGLLVRELSDLDRRLVYAVITPRGRELCLRNSEICAVIAHEYFAGALSPKDMRMLIRMLSQILARK
ncbi:MarR family winged helix-turn-helix transcriptional regulator [Jatrophihabitans sp. DSM 45814]